jgi:hypothetical protein
MICFCIIRKSVFQTGELGSPLQLTDNFCCVFTVSCNYISFSALKLRKKYTVTINAMNALGTNLS